MIIQIKHYETDASAGLPDDSDIYTVIPVIAALLLATGWSIGTIINGMQEFINERDETRR